MMVREAAGRLQGTDLQGRDAEIEIEDAGCDI